ncbi:MerR family transcriptional regulator [Bacillus taeanensis]|uniref:MerR family transcriptional regulator n=1 Tax=Bacillus taeanensis TaxID=273032 RepID=A0A366XW29_9BACI|nr:MerR family transcriptional regulator [Bacillus taeanensis]RBW68969.1 MerR family transcriptional regulator [Bacillus taeanensis]
MDEIKRNEALFPISVVKEITNLTARQIRYYEEQGLINPGRNKGNHRVYSLNDIARCLEIKRYIDQGLNIAGIKAVYDSKVQEKNIIPNHMEKLKIDLSDLELRELLVKVKKKIYGS